MKRIALILLLIFSIFGAHAQPVSNSGTPLSTGFVVNSPAPVDNKTRVFSADSLTQLPNQFWGLTTATKYNTRLWVRGVSVWKPVAMLSDLQNIGNPANVVTGLVSAASITKNNTDNSLNLVTVKWKINGVEYVKATTNIPLQEASPDQYRSDIVVGNSDGTISIILGVESESNATPPVVPANKALITVVNVFGNSVDIDGTGNDFLLKSQQGEVQFSTTGTVALQWGAKNTRRWVNTTSSSLIITSLDNNSSPGNNGQAYSQRPYIIIHDGGIGSITLQHNSGTGNLKFWFKDAGNLVLLKGDIATFLYSGISNRLELHSINRSTGGGSGLTNVYGVTDETTSAPSGTTTTIGISPNYTSAQHTYINAQIAAAAVPASSETVIGKIQRATQIEVNAGVEDTKAFTSAKLASWWATTKTIFTTDFIVEGSVKKTVSITAAPPTANYTFRYVTAAAEVQGIDHTGMTGPGFFVKETGVGYSITQNQRAGIITKWTGDSEMNGFQLTNGSQSYPTKVSNQFGWTVIDNRTNGTKLIDKYKGLLDTDIAEIRFTGLGTNDARLYTTAGAAAYANLMRGHLLSAYAPYATTGQQMTLSGTDWANDTYQTNTTTGVYTTTNGATATFKRVGTTVYITIALMPGGSATHTITIDGTPMSVLSANDSGVFSSIGYPVPSGGATTGYYPYTYRYSGLAAGEHTIIITKTGGTSQLRVMWALSNKQIGTNMSYRGISQYIIPVTKMQPGTGNTTTGTGYAYWGGSDATIDAYNSAAKTIIYEFNDDELDMRLLDINKVFHPYITGYLQADLLHFTATATKEIADFIIGKLTAYPVREQQRLDRLQEYLDQKLGTADLSNYGVLTANNSWTGTFNTFTALRIASLQNTTGSTTNGTGVQSTSNNGWGFQRNSTSATGAALWAQQNNSAAIGDHFNVIRWDGVVLGGFRFDGRAYGATPTAVNDYTTKAYVDALQITTTATLNFPSTAPNTNSSLTVTATGAVVGDVVTLGAPDTGVTTNHNYSARVTATDTVTVRFNNNDTTTTVDPASGTFKVKILK